jgi:hypothetical protein
MDGETNFQQSGISQRTIHLNLTARFHVLKYDSRCRHSHSRQPVRFVSSLPTRPSRTRNFAPEGISQEGSNLLGAFTGQKQHWQARSIRVTSTWRA